MCQSHEDGCDFALEPLFLELHVGIPVRERVRMRMKMRMKIRMKIRMKMRVMKKTGDYKTYMVYLGHEHEYWRMLPTGSTNGTISETSYEVFACFIFFCVLNLIFTLGPRE